MLKLPFLINRKKTSQISEDFLGITVSPFKVSVLYFMTPPHPDPDNPNLSGLTSQQTSGFVTSSPEPHLKLISARSRYISAEAIFQEAGDPSLITQTVQEILDEMREEYTQIPSHAIFGISADHCLDLMSIVSYTNPEPSRFNTDQVKNLYAQAEKNATFRAQDLLAGLRGDMDTDLVRITGSTVYQKIDGSKVEDAIGLEGRELELSWFGSFVEAPYLKFIESISKKLKLEIITASSLGYAFYMAIQEASTAYSNCVIINMGTDATEVHVVFGSGLIGARYMNIGTISIVEEISRKLDLHHDEAFQVLEKYKSGTLSGSIFSEVQKILQKFLVIFGKSLCSIFSDFSGVKTFSPIVLLVGEGFDIPDVADYVMTEPWHKSIPFKYSPKFEKGRVSDLFDSVLDLSGAGSSMEWSFPLSLGQVYYKVAEK